MGGQLINVVQEKEFSMQFHFLKNYLTHEKIQLLCLLNIDFFIEVEPFCSFFLCNEEIFEYIDKNGNGVVLILEVILYLHILREKSAFSKITDIVDLFIISDPLFMTESEFSLMADIFISIIEKFFNEDLNFVKEEQILFTKQIFENSDFLLSKEVKRILENQIELVELLNFIQTKASLSFK